MQVRFGTEFECIVHKYTRISDLSYHIAQCRKIWSSISNKEWMHKFIHTLDKIPMNRYLELEMHRETMDWDEMIQSFKVTFNFEDEALLVDITL
jgi:hypothetical protein